MSRPLVRHVTGSERAVPGSQPRRLSDWLSHPGFILILAALLGLFLGLQFFTLNPRIVKIAIGLIVLYVFIRYPVYVGVGLYIVVYSFPTAIFIGSTNTIFAILLFVSWVIKFTLGLEPKPRSSLLGGGILLLVLVTFVSFVMLDDSLDMGRVVRLQEFFVFAVLVYAIMVNAVNTPRQLHYVLQAMTFSFLLVYLLEIQEWLIPSVKIIPKWYIATLSKGGGSRAAGVYESHGLLADSSAINVILQLFLITRARKVWRKVYHGVVATLAVIMISLAVNRGGFIILVVGLCILGWHLRRDIRFSYVIVGFPLLILAFYVAEGVTRTRLGGITLFLRLGSTRLESYLPASRVGIWKEYIDLIKESPILGHGPYIPIDRLLWPHNTYLYFWYTIGVLGLAIFLWILFKAIWKTRPRDRVSWLRSSYVKGASLFVHIAIIQFAVGQLRTDFQRPNQPFVYLAFIMFGLAAIVWSLNQQEKRVQMSRRGVVDRDRRSMLS